MTPARENERPAEIRGVSFTIRGNDPFASQISSRNDPIAEIAINVGEAVLLQASRRGAR